MLNICLGGMEIKAVHLNRMDLCWFAEGDPSGWILNLVMPLCQLKQISGTLPQIYGIKISLGESWTSVALICCPGDALVSCPPLVNVCLLSVWGPQM